MKKLRSIYLLLLCAALMFTMLSCAVTEADDKKAENIESNVGTTVEKLYNFSYNKTEYNLKNLDDVKNIVDEAREMYKGYESFVFLDGEKSTTSIVPELTVEMVKKTEDVRDSKFDDYLSYLGTTSRIILEIFQQELPGNAILDMQEYTTNFPYPNYYFVEYDKFGFSSSYDAYVKVIIKESCNPKEIGDFIYATRDKIYYYDFETKEDILLFPSAEEYEIKLAIMKARTAADQDPNYYIERDNLDVK